MTTKGSRRTAGWLAAALLLGGWREPRLFALGGAALWAEVLLARPALGPAAAWLPWLGWAALAGLAGLQPAAALAPLARWAAALAFFSLAAAWDERGRRTWVKTLLVVALVLAAAAAATGAGRGFGAAMTGLLPPYYNYTAFVLAAASAAAAAWVLHPRGPRGAWRFASFAAAAAGVAALLLARSRGATLGLLIAALVWSLRRWGRRAAVAGAAAAALALAAWGAGLFPASLTAAILKRDRQYPDVRAQIWREAVDVAAEAPWLGVGPGSFGPAFARRPVEEPGGPARWGMGTEHAHSEPLQAAAETGWAGLLLWLIGAAAAFRVLLRRQDAEPAREAAAAALVAMSAQLLLDNMLHIPGLALLFFSAAAVAGARAPGALRWPRAAAAAGFALTLASWIPRALAGAEPARAAELFPAEAGPREDLAYAATAAGRLADADRYWSEAAERAPFDAVYPWRRAQLAAAQGRGAEAEAFAAQALALEPGFLSARMLRAEILARAGRRKDARAELDEVRRRVDRRKDIPAASGYELTVWTYDAAEFARASALAAGPDRAAPRP